MRRGAARLNQCSGSNVRPVTTPGTLPHCLKGVGGTPTRRTGHKPKCIQYEGLHPVRREHASDAALDGQMLPAGALGRVARLDDVVEALRDDLLKAGRMMPVEIDGGEEGAYLFYAVEAVVDCVDQRRSSTPKKATDQMKTTVFRRDALPSGLQAFRVPEFPGGVHWNGWAVGWLREILGADLEARLIWSEDSALTPHPDPWGF